MVNATSTSSSWVEPSGWTIVKLTFSVIIAVAGVMGNILVYLAVTRAIKTKKPMNTFLLSLATADLGVLLMNFPIAVVKERSPNDYLLGRFFCLYIGPATETFFCASIWSIAAIAIHRYRNIIGVRGMMQNPPSVKTSRIETVIIWFASFLATSLPLYFVVAHENGRCGPAWESAEMERAYNIFLALVLYILPLAAISFTYLRIRRSVLHSIRLRAAMEQQQRQQQTHIRRQLEKSQKILTPLVILFAITMLPLTILRLVIQYTMMSPQSFLIAYNISVIGVIINSALNPVLYFFVSKELRRAYLRIIHTTCCPAFSSLFVRITTSFKTTRTSKTTDRRNENGRPLENSGLYSDSKSEVFYISTV